MFVFVKMGALQLEALGLEVQDHRPLCEILLQSVHYLTARSAISHAVVCDSCLWERGGVRGRATNLSHLELLGISRNGESLHAAFHALGDVCSNPRGSQCVCVPMCPTPTHINATSCKAAREEADNAP